MISPEHRCIFVHIPKTAGNSVNRALGVAWADHKDLQRYFEELPRELFASYFKFAIVRNPWDRLLSDYNYQAKKSRGKNSKLFVFTERGQKRNFAEWVEAALADPAYYEPHSWGAQVSPHIHRWSPQLDWISVDGEPHLDFVAHLERLPEDFRAIRRHLDLPAVRLPHRNRRFHWHYSRYYDRGTRDLVTSYYARDIEFFGYEFEHAMLHFRVTWPGAPRMAAPGDAHAIDEPNGRAAHSVYFGASAPRRAPTSWLRRSAFAAAACLAVLLGRLEIATASDAAPTALTRRAVGQLYSDTTGTSARAPARDPFFRLTQRAMNAGLTLEMIPATIPSFVPVFWPAGPATPSDVSSPAPRAAGNRSGSDPSLSRWIGRRRAAN